VVSSKDGDYEIRARAIRLRRRRQNEGHDLRSGMTLVPFNKELNRLLLVATHGGTRTTRSPGQGHENLFREQLAKGVNLADEFEMNPFSDAFAKVDAAWPPSRIMRRAR